MYNSNKVITTVIIIYFILRTHGIIQIFPAMWVGPLMILILHSIHTILTQKNGDYIILLKDSKWIILSLFILFSYVFFDYGNFKLTNTFNYLLSSLPFYIIGFEKGCAFNNKFIKNITVGYLLFLTLFLLPKSFISITSGRVLTELFVDDINDGGYIFFLPFTSFLTLFGAVLLLQSQLRYAKTIAFTIFTINLIALFLSGKAGPIALLLCAFIFYYIKKGVNLYKKYRNILFSLITVLLFIFSFSFGLFGEAGTLRKKSTAIIDLISSGFEVNVDVLNKITSDRWSLDAHSVEQFFKKPIFGHGAYLESIAGMIGSNAETITTAAGGHSFIFDTMAFYGLCGLPIIFILLKFTKDAIRYYELVRNNTNEAKISLVYASLMIGLVFVNVLNSGFLFSPFDNYLFLLAGFYLGKRNFFLNRRYR